MQKKIGLSGQETHKVIIWLRTPLVSCLDSRKIFPWIQMERSSPPMIQLEAETICHGSPESTILLTKLRRFSPSRCPALNAVNAFGDVGCSSSKAKYDETSCMPSWNIVPGDSHLRDVHWCMKRVPKIRNRSRLSRISTIEEIIE